MICKVCGEEKKHQGRGMCNSCYNKWWSKNNYEYDRQRQKTWYQNNKDYFKKWNEKNPGKMYEAVKKWAKNNPKKFREMMNKSRKKRELEDINVRMINTISNRIRVAIKSQKGEKANKSTKLLGCSIKHCIKHLEENAPYGVTIKDHGYYGYQIDHIIPCNSFDLTKESEQLKCFHYTNLQLLWWKDNFKKSNKMEGG